MRSMNNQHEFPSYKFVSHVQNSHFNHHVTNYIRKRSVVTACLKDSQVLYSSGMWCCITRWLVTNVLKQDSGLFYKGQNVHSSITLWDYRHCFKSFSCTLPHPRRTNTPKCTASKVYKLMRRIKSWEIIIQLVKIFPAFYGPWSWITGTPWLMQ
jgi:hypothetical protein